VTGKERILATLAGETPDRVPFVPNIWQWYHVNRYNGSLPLALAGTASPVEALKVLGAGIFSKFDGGLPQPVYHVCAHNVTFEGEFPTDRVPWTPFASFEGGPVRREQIETPHGILGHAWEYRADTGAAFELEHWLKDMSEFPAVRFWMEDTEWAPDWAALRRGRELIGDDGTFIFKLLPSPLKQLHWLAGQVNATYMILDHPQEMRELAAIHEQKSIEYLEQVVDLDEVWVFEVADTLDSLFATPKLFEEFCVPSIKKQAEMVHARGKYLFIHACGQLKKLAPLMLEAGLDCAEGQAPPPIGDWPLHEAKALSERFILCGGMAAPQQELRGPDASLAIDSYVRDLFVSMGDKRRFLFGSSCNTSPLTPYKNLLGFRDASWRYGEVR
jgi:hypothetical protein